MSSMYFTVVPSVRRREASLGFGGLRSDSCGMASLPPVGLFGESDAQELLRNISCACRFSAVPDDKRSITDSRVLAAMAHPVRRRLLDLVKLDGPSTASVLAQRTGEAIGN